MSIYPKAIKKLIPPGPNDPPINARVAILHVRAGEGPSLYDYFNGPSGGIESHFYIRYDGTVEQYRDTAFQADANMAANDFAVSIETEGFGGGTWTVEQISAIKELLRWLHEVEEIPLQVVKTWNGSGVGFHVLFEDKWDGRHATCPGLKRQEQFWSIIAPWLEGEPAHTKTQAPASAIPRLPQPKTRKAQLTVDGALGEKTIRAWQDVNGTPEDGVISEPSLLIKAVQRFLNNKGITDRRGRKLAVDGLGVQPNLGKDYGPTRTIEALQKYYGTPVDGILSADHSTLVKALQTALNRSR